MNTFKRFAVAAATAAAALVFSAGAASADHDPDVIDIDVHDVLQNITVLVPINVLLQDNVLGLLGVATDGE